MRVPLTTVAILLTFVPGVHAQSDFRVPPYVQNPSLSGITVRWFSNADVPGELIIGTAEGPVDTVLSTPVEARELEYPSWEVGPSDFPPDNVIPGPPFKHSVRLEGLVGNAQYWYRVTQGTSIFQSSFRTAPGIRDPIRFVVYSDSETEPNPVEPFASWADPLTPESGRRYLIDQKQGYANNLTIIRDRDPDFVAIAGDLVQAGGEQRDWDEFWRHNTEGSDALSSLAGSVPIVAVPGNHEYYSSPHEFKSYRQPWSEMAMDKFSAYFDAPKNGSATSEGRYFRFDYGPVSIIGIDVSNNGLNQTPDDTNLELLGDVDGGGGNAPSFDPGSPQYEWLDANLSDARLERPFVFVLMHYAPYSVGPHGWPNGEGENEDPLSGVPVRNLTPLFMKYGVDAVFSGHDEMWERSVVEGFETRPDGTMREHRIHFYDVGTGGDGLRGPQQGLTNPFQAFLVHRDVPEEWDGATLIDGGKHYGHLEVTVQQVERDVWEAILTPVYSFPLFVDGAYAGFERRTYNDVIVLSASDSLRALSTPSSLPTRPDILLAPAFPNPASGSTTVSFELSRPASASLVVYDATGRRVTTLVSGRFGVGHHTYRWNGKDDSDRLVTAGAYFVRLESDAGIQTAAVIVTR